MSADIRQDIVAALSEQFQESPAINTESLRFIVRVTAPTATTDEIFVAGLQAASILGAREKYLMEAIRCTTLAGLQLEDHLNAGGALS